MASSVFQLDTKSRWFVFKHRLRKEVDLSFFFWFQSFGNGQHFWGIRQNDFMPRDIGNIGQCHAWKMTKCGYFKHIQDLTLWHLRTCSVQNRFEEVIFLPEYGRHESKSIATWVIKAGKTVGDFLHVLLASVSHSTVDRNTNCRMKPIVFDFFRDHLRIRIRYCCSSRINFLCINKASSRLLPTTSYRNQKELNNCTVSWLCLGEDTQH